MVMNEICSKLEALLFAAGDPIPVSRLSLVLQVPETDIIEAADDLSAAFKENGHSLCVLKLGDKLQICTCPEYSDIISRILELRKPSVLSAPALETLAVVAYYQPVTIAYISKLRGVDSSYTVSSLSDKGLIEISGRMEAPGRPALYSTTDLFLRTMNISNLSELPKLPDMAASDGIEKLQQQIDSLGASQNSSVQLQIAEQDN